MSNDIRKFMNMLEAPLDGAPRDNTGRRQDDNITYTDVGADKVVAKLNSYASQSYTKLAQKIQRATELEAEASLLREQAKAEGREMVADLFSAHDVVKTRVVETVSFVVQLTKDPKPTETFKYAQIIKDLESQLTPELIQVLEALKTKYKSVTQKSGALSIEPRTESVVAEAGFGDKLKGFFAKFKAAIMNWGTKYDAKLANLKTQAQINEGSLEEDIGRGFDVARLEKLLDFMAAKGLTKQEIVDKVATRFGEDQAEHADMYCDAIMDPVPAMEDAEVDAVTINGKQHMVEFFNTEIKPVTESDVMMLEFKRFLGEAMAFPNGATLFCGSRSGKLVGRVQGKPDALVVELPNGERDVFPAGQCTMEKPGFAKRAMSWAMGEDEEQGVEQGLTEGPANYDCEVTIPNPVEPPDEDLDPEGAAAWEEEITVGVNYQISGSYRPAIIRADPNDSAPEEWPDLDILGVFDLTTGQDISKSLSRETIARIQDQVWEHADQRGSDYEPDYDPY